MTSSAQNLRTAFPQAPRALAFVSVERKLGEENHQRPLSNSAARVSVSCDARSANWRRYIHSPRHAPCGPRRGRCHDEGDFLRRIATSCWAIRRAPSLGVR